MEKKFESEEFQLKMNLMKSNLSSTAQSIKTGGKVKKENKKKSTTKVTKKKVSKDKSKTKKRKESIQSENNTETDTTCRKWDDFKNKKTNFKGQFTAEEEKLVVDALCQYAYENQLDQESILKLITEKQTKKDSSIWTKVSECLPNRSVQSVHNFCHRKLNPYNYKGQWSQDEIDKMIKLYEEHGAKWELIGKELERTATNVKDKFKNIGGKNYKKRQPEFNLSSVLKLVKYVQSYLSTEDEPIEILNYDFKFKNDLEEEKSTCYFVDQEKNKFFIDSSIKETERRIIIRNILKLLINFEVLEKIVEQKMEISWSVISSKYSNFSQTDCSNNWEKILREFNLVEKSALRKDLKMVRQILNCEYDGYDEVNFEIIKNKRSAEENKVKLQEMLRLNDIYSVKSFKDVLIEIQQQLEKRLKYSKNEDEEFEEELKKNKPFSFTKVYNEFLSNKRLRK